ncbi:MAG TPA: hypothetical protein VGR41_09920 [Actinomycetota bacterium]|nr:hypothetical protein [Actinomycetota bacterium]
MSSFVAPGLAAASVALAPRVRAIAGSQSGPREDVADFIRDRLARTNCRP